MDVKEFVEFSHRFNAAVRGGTVRPVPVPGSGRFCYADGAPDRTVIWDVDPGNGTRRQLLDADHARKALENAIGRALPSEGLPFAEFEFAAPRRIRIFDMDPVVDLDLDTYEVTLAPDIELELQRRAVPRSVRKGYIPFSTDPREIPSPDGTMLLGEQGHNLAIRAVVDDKQQLLTTDGIEGHAWQVDGPLWWAPGAEWSHDAQRLAVVRKDVRQCAKLPVVAWLQTNELVEYHPYARQGGSLPINSAALIDVRSRYVRGVHLPGERDQIIVPVGWRRDGTEAYFMTTDRRRKYLRLYAVPVSDGDARLVCEETQETFIIGIRQVDRFVPAMLLADDRRLLWFSERDGWRHLYLYSTDGTELARLTSGEFEVLKVIGVDIGNETVFFTAQSDVERPYDVHVCSVRLDGSAFRQLTTQPGVHEAVLTSDKRHLIDTHSAIDRPPSTDLLSVDGTVVTTLATADVSGLAGLRLPRLEPFTAKAADGRTDLYGVLYLPPGFDAAKRYPVIEYQYGGPQTIAHPVAFADVLGYFGMAAALAAQGFVVYTVDGRGTPGRGKAFQDVVYGRFHEYHVEDHAHVLGQLLERHSFMDASRVGVTGASWGGYATVRTMVLTPDLYHVGVAVCPVYDLDDQNAFAIEPYMGVAADRPEAFAAGSSCDMADRLKGKLLMIQGTSDVNATFSATMKMCEALARADKPYDLVIVPEADHGFTAGGMHQKRYMEASTLRYFAEHLRL